MYCSAAGSFKHGFRRISSRMSWGGTVRPGSLWAVCLDAAGSVQSAAIQFSLLTAVKYHNDHVLLGPLQLIKHRVPAGKICSDIHRGEWAQPESDLRAPRGPALTASTVSAHWWLPESFSLGVGKLTNDEKLLSPGFKLVFCCVWAYGL